MDVSDFDSDVQKALFDCGADIQHILKNNTVVAVGVSGGADSISLLTSMCHIFSPHKILVNALSVNHFIRSEEESSGDALFVVDFCESLKKQGFLVEATVLPLKKGEAFEFASNHKCGIEAAARALRYEQFDTFLKKYPSSVLALAHTKDDFLETMLMRFFKGSSVDGLCGIPPVRKNIIRPLLGISRQKIEGYLTAQGIQWRTDSTNFDESYFRNKIRLKLVPFLNENFPFWQSSLLSAAEKNKEDSKVLKSLADAVFQKQPPCSEAEEKEIFIRNSDFDLLPLSIKVRVLLKAFNQLGFDGRVPYGFLKSAAETKTGVQSFGGIEVFHKKEGVFVKKTDNLHTDFVFFDIIEKEGDYDFCFGLLSVIKDGAECEKSAGLYINGEDSSLRIKLPFVVRSAVADDRVLAADKSFKKVSSLFSDWHVGEKERRFIPVIQELTSPEQRIVGVLGFFMGFKNWIVK